MTCPASCLTKRGTRRHQQIDPFMVRQSHPIVVSSSSTPGSGATSTTALLRPNAVVEGDELVITALSRLGRTQREVINRLHELQERGIHVLTLDGLVNTKAMGKMAPVLISLLTGLNEVEREVTRDRVMESIEHRKATGRSIGGRPKTNQAKERLVLRLRDEGCSYRSIREQTGLALSTIRRFIAEQEAEAVSC